MPELGDTVQVFGQISSYFKKNADEDSENKFVFAKEIKIDYYNILSGQEGDNELLQHQLTLEAQKCFFDPFSDY